MSTYLVASMILSKMTSRVAPCFEIPPHMWNLGGCLSLYFNFLGVIFFESTSTSDIQAAQLIHL